MQMKCQSGQTRRAMKKKPIWLYALATLAFGFMQAVLPARAVAAGVFFPQEEAAEQPPESSAAATDEAEDAQSAEAVRKEDDAEKAFLSNVRQLTFGGKRSGEGYFSADGSRMIFQSEREPENPFYQIYLMDLEFGDIARLSPGVGKTTCGWLHPDGKRALFSSTHLDPEAAEKQKQELEDRAAGEQKRYSWSYDEQYDIFQSDLNGGNLANLTHEPGYDAEASWSPDGSRIAFASNRSGYQEELSKEDAEKFEADKSLMMEIYIMNSDGSDMRRLTRAKGYDGGPFFSPDGKRITWRRFSEDGATAEVFVMNADGTDQRPATHLGAMSWAPYFHPSGDYIVFTTNIHGFDNFELYIVDAQGKSDPVRVTSTKGFDGLPVFSPDGKKLSWTSGRTPDGSSQIFIADWNDAAAREALGLAGGETAPEISTDDLRLRIGYLASEKMEGRLTGTEGEQLAADYIVDQFKQLGLQPDGDGGGWLQEFEFIAGVSLGPDNRMEILEDGGKAAALEPDKDWRPLAFSMNGKVEAAEVAFAGYGISAPKKDDFDEYDSYTHMDVKGKWVLAFRYLPENITPENRQRMAGYSSLRYKAMAARDRGAAGILIVSGPNSNVKKHLADLSFDAALAGTSVAVISISDETAEKLLKMSGKSLKALQDELDGGDPMMGFDLPGVKVAAAIDLKQEVKKGRNVIGRLNAGAAPSGEAVALGAHYDHLGRGQTASTLARSDEQGQIHFGADDNASGTAGMIEIAEYMADLKKQGRLPMKRDLLFAAWSGEELGVIGSAHYADQIVEAKGKDATIRPEIMAYLNMDMIGRLKESLTIYGLGSSSIWAQELEQRNAPIGLSIVAQDDAYLPTDATSFYLKGAPILSGFTGAHEDYHTPRDTVDKINFEGAQKISRLFASLARSLVMMDQAPDYREMEKPGDAAGRLSMRAYLGTIPDYSQSDAMGVKLSGVAKGGPADKAGVKGGDIIVELAGKSIENIYDYTYAIEALKIGEEAGIAVLRDGERVEMTVTPSSRE